MSVASDTVSRLARRVPLLSAAVLALPLLVGTHTPVWADDDQRPDLKIELINAPIPNGEHELQFRVTNVSVWWADETMAHIETVPPVAGSGLDVRIENLDPAQSTTFSYTLAAGCDGQVVRAEVAAAGNYEGVKESNVDNNRIQAAACAAQGQAGPIFEAPRSVLPAAAAAAPVVATALDVNASLGELKVRPKPVVVGASKMQTLTIKPSAAQVAHRGNIDPKYEVVPGPGLAVGWDQNPEKTYRILAGLGLDYWGVTQTAINFDLRFLQEVPGTRVREAVLRYTESKWDWRDGAGNDLSVGSCVQVLGRATEEWQGRTGGGTGTPRQFANEKVQGHTPGVSEWFVTSEIRDQWTDNVYPPLGFVLRGGNESPQGHDARSCTSLIGNVTLEVTFEVPF
jgi:hypothetical protein